MMLVIVSLEQKKSAAKVELKNLVWYPRHDTMCFDVVVHVNEYLSAEKHTEFSYVTRSVTQNLVKSKWNWLIKIGKETGNVVPVSFILGHQNAPRVGSD